MENFREFPFSSIYTTLSEREQNDQLRDKLVEEFGSINNQTFITQARIIAFEKLPRRHILAVTEMGAMDWGFKAIILKGICTIDQQAVGLTPNDWESINIETAKLTAGFELIQYLYISLIGYVIEIEEQRGGGACHDILPVSGYEEGQTGASSHSVLKMHTEDTPLDHCCHYLSLFCIRNYERAESALCSIHDLEISADDRAILSEAHFIIPPDPSIKINEKEEIEYELKPVLFGNRQAPYIRVAFAEQLEEEIQTQIEDEPLAALKRLEQEVNQKTFLFIPESGDLVIFSNLQCLHGRGSFTPNYKSGKTRWMKRMMGVDGLSSSLKYRNPGSRLITEKSYK